LIIISVAFVTNSTIGSQFQPVYLNFRVSQRLPSDLNYANVSGNINILVFGFRDLKAEKFIVCAIQSILKL